MVVSLVADEPSAFRAQQLRMQEKESRDKERMATQQRLLRQVRGGRSSRPTSTGINRGKTATRSADSEIQGGEAGAMGQAPACRPNTSAAIEQGWSAKDQEQKQEEDHPTVRRQKPSTASGANGPGGNIPSLGRRRSSSSVSQSWSPLAARASASQVPLRPASAAVSQTFSELSDYKATIPFGARPAKNIVGMGSSKIGFVGVNLYRGKLGRLFDTNTPGGRFLPNKNWAPMLSSCGARPIGPSKLSFVDKDDVSGGFTLSHVGGTRDSPHGSLPLTKQPLSPHGSLPTRRTNRTSADQRAVAEGEVQALDPHTREMLARNSKMMLVSELAVPTTSVTQETLAAGIAPIFHPPPALARADTLARYASGATAGPGEGAAQPGAAHLAHTLAPPPAQALYHTHRKKTTRYQVDTPLYISKDASPTKGVSSVETGLLAGRNIPNRVDLSTPASMADDGAHHWWRKQYLHGATYKPRPQPPGPDARQVTSLTSRVAQPLAGQETPASTELRRSASPIMRSRAGSPLKGTPSRPGSTVARSRSASPLKGGRSRPGSPPRARPESPMGRARPESPMGRPESPMGRGGRGKEEGGQSEGFARAMSAIEGWEGEDEGHAGPLVVGGGDAK